jgi:hypothetical protein
MSLRELVAADVEEALLLLRDVSAREAEALVAART